MNSSSHPELLATPWTWRDASATAEVVFVGRGAPRDAGRALAALDRAPSRLAYARQVHSARVVEVAQPGLAGEADALITRAAGLALAVVTADCVPVLLAGAESVAAVHAGWRGIAAGIVGETLAALGRSEPGARFEAWIGPSIGVCCYEVDDDVAGRVVAASDPAASSPGSAGKPHLDLVHAVEHQLAAAGVERTRSVGGCTRCDAEELWSYRREGAGAGRNLAFVWRRPAGGAANGEGLEAKEAACSAGCESPPRSTG